MIDEVTRTQPEKEVVDEQDKAIGQAHMASR